MKCPMNLSLQAIDVANGKKAPKNIITIPWVEVS